MFYTKLNFLYQKYKFCMVSLVSMLMLLALMAIPQVSSAKTSSIEKISYAVQKTDNGEDYLHIEFATNRPVKEFSANFNPNNTKQLIFRMKDSRLSHIPRQENLDGTIGNKIFLQEMDHDYVQGKLYVNSELTNKNYKIYAIDKNSSTVKPKAKNGIAIDIFSKAEASGRKKATNTASVENLNDKSVTIDPGHGGSDSGAIGPNGYMEKEATLAISQKLADILENSGATVVMTRDSDTDVYGPNASDRAELQARVNVGNRAGTDIFVSIHCNAFANPSANGTQTFYYGGSYEGQRLANDIQQEMIATNGLRDRGIATANFYVMKYSSMPAVLVETAFITNPDEEALLSDPQWQEQLAEAISQGISDYFAN